MTLYHGSDHVVDEPKYGLGKKNNDYGRGFYCTEDFDLAKEWAVDMDRDGFANEYRFDMDGLCILDLTEKGYSVLHWITILLKNREFMVESPIAREAKRYLFENFLIDYEAYDIISGYRADDSYFAYARDFVNNVISVQQLEKAMKYGNLGKQIVLKSEKAFERISFVKAINADRSIWYPQREKRDIKARSNYLDSDRMPFKKGETYILKIIEEELMPDDIFK